MSGWTGMDEALRTLAPDRAADAVDQALEHTAAVGVEDVRQEWPTKTGASAAGWLADGKVVRNDRRDVSHIQAGEAAARARRTLEGHAPTLERELHRLIEEG